jgi:cystathionine gamma-synthase
VLQRPLALGADVVMHSTTKYFGGHSDVLGGALVCGADGDVAQRLRAIQMAGGAVPSPFECWLLVRGIRTLPVRVAAQCSNAGALAAHLAKHSKVKAVHYPGLSSHPQHAIAKRQMSDFGAMMSIEVGASADEARAIAARLRLFTQATSLGGTESLIEHRASVEGPGTLAPANLLRISVGLENAQDLIADWEAALR